MELPGGIGSMSFGKHPGFILRNAAIWLLLLGASSPSQGASVQASHTGCGYNSPGVVLVSCEFSYEPDRQLLALLWTPGMPAQWNLEEVFGHGSPEINSNSQKIVFTAALTNNPVVFEYTVTVPPGYTGPQALAGQVEYQLDSMTNALPVLADPDPLFVDSHHRIDASANNYGWIDPSGVVIVAHGGSANFDMWPDTYYHVSNVLVDATGIGSMSSYSFTNVTCDRTIDVVFAENLACMGTPEWWLAAHGLTNETVDFCAAETNDVDSDGMPAWAEWQSDTIPTNSDSVLEILSILRTGADVNLQWKGGTNAWQSLETRHDLVDTTAQWHAIFTNEPPTDLLTDFLHTNVTSPQLFYRVKAWRQ